MKIGSAVRVVCALLLAMSGTPAFAQATSTSSLSGVVVDASGGAIPGATVVVKDNATGVTVEGVSNASGRFVFAALNGGTYTVTVSLTGFRTFVASDVRLVASRPAEITAKLEIGSLTDTVSVRARTELVQTQSATVSSTLLTEQLSQLPLVSRNALYSLTSLPGVSTAGGPRAALINGLPNNTVNITIDGVATGNALQSGDGFFSMVTPRMDAVEEVTVTGAVPGVGAGAGSVQVAFTTRSGTNQFDSSMYLFWRDPRFNSNYYFNKVNGLPRNNVQLYQYGGRLGGPIVLPGLDGRGKAFFFFNMEHLHQPSSATRTRTVLKDSASAGVFSYDRTVGGVTTLHQVDLLALAAANGQQSALDPTVLNLLARIKTATGTTGSVTSTTARNINQYNFQAEGVGDQYAPTSRVDINLGAKHRLTGTYALQRFKSNPDLLNNAEVRFPGFANFGTQNSYRTVGSVGLRTTVSASAVNVMTGGWQWSPNDFFANVTPEMFADQGGYAILFPAVDGAGVTGATSRTNSAPRNTTTWSVSDELSWLKGGHTLSFGGSFAGVHNRTNSYDAVPVVNFGFDTTSDPAAGMFNSTNFPGASTATLTSARNLYGLLTGRVIAINGTARLDASTGQYVYLGDLTQRARAYSAAAFMSDSWRVKPTLSLNAGLRWDVQLPFTPVTPTFSTTTLADFCGISGVGTGPDGRACNLFQPGVQPGQAQPTYQLYSPGDSAYRTNWSNLGFNVGGAWRTNVQGGWLRSLLGDPEQATIRAGYSMTYNVERFDRFTNNAGANPGGTLNVNRNATTGFCLVCPGETWPVLYSQKGRLGPPAFPAAPVYPLPATTGTTMNLFQQDLRTPRVHSYSVGFQRSIGSDTAFEIRYVGNRNKFAWAEENWNERVLFENGFFNEFLLARANLKANLAAGRGATFAYTGAPGTSPLPIHQAYLSGRSGADVTNPARYTATQYSNAAFYNRFSELEPEVGNAAAALDTTAFRPNALAAGLASNFFVMNPATGGAFIVQDREGTRFNSVQLEVRRRLSGGLLVSGSYTYGVRNSLNLRSIRLDRLWVDSTQVPHEVKANWTYEIPVGRGKRYGTGLNKVVDGLVGGWQVSGNARFQSARFLLANVKLVGMTVDDLRKEFKIRKVTDPTTGAVTVYSMPQDIIDNTRRAFSTDPTTVSGYSDALGAPTGRYLRPSSDAACVAVYRGDCGAADITINGPLFVRLDLSVKKAFTLGRRATFELSADLLNALDSVNFNHALTPGETAAAFQVTTAFRDENTTNDPGGRLGQIGFRIKW